MSYSLLYLHEIVTHAYKEITCQKTSMVSPDFQRIPMQGKNDRLIFVFCSLISIVVRPTILYINSKAVFPAKLESSLKRLDSGSSPK
jgi:hypothetical protein